MPMRDSLTDFGAALVPVLFAYGGWQTANFIVDEMLEPRRDLPRALLLGVAGVGADLAGAQGGIASKRDATELPSWMPELEGKTW